MSTKDKHGNEHLSNIKFNSRIPITVKLVKYKEMEKGIKL